MTDLEWISFIADLRYYWLVYSGPVIGFLVESIQFLVLFYLYYKIDKLEE